MEKQISEKEFMTQVIQLAKLYGWKVAHFRPAMTKHGWRTAVQADGKGWPDLAMVRSGRLIFAELKRDGGRETDEQLSWLTMLAGVPSVESYTWHPADWETIIEILR